MQREQQFFDTDHFGEQDRALCVHAFQVVDRLCQIQDAFVVKCERLTQIVEVIEIRPEFQLECPEDIIEVVLCDLCIFLGQVDGLAPFSGEEDELLYLDSRIAAGAQIEPTLRELIVHILFNGDIRVGPECRLHSSATRCINIEACSQELQIAVEKALFSFRKGEPNRVRLRVGDPAAQQPGE